MRSTLTTLFVVALVAAPAAQNRYKATDGKLRIALAQQPLGPNGPSKGPDTMASGGIQEILGELGATVRQEKTEGPGGTFCVIADPTGADVALWQAAA